MDQVTNGGEGNKENFVSQDTVDRLLRETEAAEERRRNPTPLEAVAQRVAAAGTREELREARRVMEEWLDEHPEDEYYFMEGGPGDGLYRREAYLDRMSEEELQRHDRKVIEDREAYARLKAAGDAVGILRLRGHRVPPELGGADGDRQAGPS